MPLHGALGSAMPARGAQGACSTSGRSVATRPSSQYLPPGAGGSLHTPCAAAGGPKQRGWRQCAFGTPLSPPALRRLSRRAASPGVLLGADVEVAAALPDAAGALGLLPGGEAVDAALGGGGGIAGSANRSSPQQEQPQPQLADVTAQLEGLKAMMTQQQQFIQMQHAQLEELKSAVARQAAISEPVQPALGAPAQLPSRASSPFEAQRIAFGDRRLKGMYDARFHSTHA